MFEPCEGAAVPLLVSVEMTCFDKRMALDVVEDALTALGPQENRGFAIGLSGGFYLCGLLSKEEWESILARIVKRQGRVSQ